TKNSGGWGEPAVAKTH
ncbi:pilZ domain protein, partial [Vibrio parahaemolyticus V-223/04]